MGLTQSSIGAKGTAARLKSFKRHVRHDVGPVFQIEQDLQKTTLITYAIKYTAGWFYFCVVEAQDSQRTTPSVCFGLQSDSVSPPTYILEFLPYLYANDPAQTIQIRDRGLIDFGRAAKGGLMPFGAAFQHLLSVRFSFDQVGERFRWIKERHTAPLWTDPIMLIPITIAEANAFQTGGCCRVLASLHAQRVLRAPLPHWLHSPMRPCSLAEGDKIQDSVLKETTQVDLRDSCASLRLGNELELSISLKISQANAFTSIFQELPIENAFVILTEHVFVGAFLAWRPLSSNGARHILVGKAMESIREVTGSFVAFLTDHKEDEFLVFEDGLFISLNVS
eukprot:TRINITY_DN4428_c0_g1_i1.p1 TRINITY_DN4428_c0_g1~~TRINITY_DN4428_c0_g1_i1.p1  ORF type:complete len:337 (+),score=25.80 TRINITY_DN4428_c0_g1_i1:134-1144(+)